MNSMLKMEVSKKIAYNNIFKGKTFYWLGLFLLLYVFNINNNEKLEFIDFSEANLLAVIILDYKYEVEIFEHKPNTISFIVPKNIDPYQRKRISKIINSDKSQSEIYMELAGDNAVSRFVEIMKKVDDKTYTRKLIVRE